MHTEAYEGLTAMVALSGIDTTQPWIALDMGGADYNGTGRDILPNAQWTGLDLRPGKGVDIVADAATWAPDREYDIVVTTELLEHTAVWRECLATARTALRSGGHLFVTCASTGRPAHGHDGLELAEGEHYGNIESGELRITLSALFDEFTVRYAYLPGDVYAWARC